MPPDATFVGRQSGVPGLSVVNCARSTLEIGGPGTDTAIPVTFGAPVTAQFSVVPDQLATPSVLGVPTDIEVGAWINTLSPGTNNIANPGRA